jgi:hypothetical protein
MGVGELVQRLALPWGRKCSALRDSAMSSESQVCQVGVKIGEQLLATRTHVDTHGAQAGPGGAAGLSGALNAAHGYWQQSRSARFMLCAKAMARMTSRSTCSDKPYPKPREGLVLGRADRPPVLGTFSPIPPYRCAKTRRCRASTKPAPSLSK